MIAERPNMSPKLNMLEPSTFPIDIAPCPFIDALILTSNSGMLVPTETMVSPITSGLIPMRFANDEAPKTNPSAP